MTLVVHTAPRAGDLDATSLEGVVARDLVDVTRHLDRAGHQAEAGALGGRFGYGVEYENDVFEMHPFCYCDRRDCEVCEDQGSDVEYRVDFPRKPHFRVKGTAIEVRWYKWIGRSMDVRPPDLTGPQWVEVMARVRASIPPVPAPMRIQRSRAKGWRMPRHAFSVTRPGPWGNPYRPNASTSRAECVDLFRRDLMLGKLPFSEADVRAHLRGWDLACWCPLPAAGEPDICHAAILLEVANR